MKNRKDRKDWFDNVVLYTKTGKAGKCPKCGSTNVECTELHIGRISLTFKCKDCGSSDHFDGQRLNP